VRWALSSTFVYSGIFAAAATTDAGFKQKRREQWDRAIADIKHDLDQPELGKTTVTQELAQAQKEKEEQIQIEQEKGEAVPWKLLFDDLREAILEDPHEEAHLDGPVWPTNTGAELHRPFVAPNSIYAKPFHRERALAARWTTKKIRTTELAVDKLVLRMLLHLDDLGFRRCSHTCSIDNLQESCPLGFEFEHLFRHPSCRGFYRRFNPRVHGKSIQISSKNMKS